MKKLNGEDYQAVEVNPMTGRIGAEVAGLDIRRATQAQRMEVRDALHQYGVIKIVGQGDISPEEHMGFAETFGPLMDLPHIPRVSGYELYHEVVREADEQTKVIGENWHCDAVFLRSPPAAIMMRAVDVPAVGGDTLFSSNYFGYDTLSDAMKEMIEPLRIVHSGTRIFGAAKNAAGIQYRQRPGADASDLAEKESAHPIVCRHAATGRKHLYVSIGTAQRIEGMTEQESRPLLDFLYQHAARPDFTCRMRWRNNDIVVWDNRAVMHRAVPDYAGHYRCLHRTTHAGSPPAH